LRDAAARIGGDVALDDHGAKFPAIHGRIGGQVGQDGVVGPAVARLGLFAADGIAGILAELISDLDHIHEAGVETEEVDGPAGVVGDSLQDLLELGIVEKILSGIVVSDASAGDGLLEGGVEQRVTVRPAGDGARLGGRDDLAARRGLRSAVIPMAFAWR